MLSTRVPENVDTLEVFCIVLCHVVCTIFSKTDMEQQFTFVDNVVIINII